MELCSMVKKKKKKTPKEMDVLRKGISDTGESKYRVARVWTDLQVYVTARRWRAAGRSCQWRWLRSGRVPSEGHVEQRKFVHTAGAHKSLPRGWRNERKDFKAGRPLIRFVLNFSCLPLWGMVWKCWVRKRILTRWRDSVPQGTLGNVWKCCRLL